MYRVFLYESADLRNVCGYPNRRCSELLRASLSLGREATERVLPANETLLSFLCGMVVGYRFCRRRGFTSPDGRCYRSHAIA